MDTKTMGKNRGERFWLLLSASLAGSGLIFAFVPVFGDVFLMPVLAAGIVSFGVFWLPYVWLENDSVVGRLVGIFPVICFFLVKSEAAGDGKEMLERSVWAVLAYMKGEESRIQISLEGEALTWGLLGICGIFLTVCMLAGSVRKLRIITMILYAAAFSFPFLHGLTIQMKGAASLMRGTVPASGKPGQCRKAPYVGSGIRTFDWGCDTEGGDGVILFLIRLSGRAGCRFFYPDGHRRCNRWENGGRSMR